MIRVANANTASRTANMEQKLKISTYPFSRLTRFATPWNSHWESTGLSLHHVRNAVHKFYARPVCKTPKTPSCRPACLPARLPQQASPSAPPDTSCHLSCPLPFGTAIICVILAAVSASFVTIATGHRPPRPPCTLPSISFHFVSNFALAARWLCRPPQEIWPALCLDQLPSAIAGSCQRAVTSHSQRIAIRVDLHILQSECIYRHSLSLSPAPYSPCTLATSPHLAIPANNFHHRPIAASRSPWQREGCFVFTLATWINWFAPANATMWSTYLCTFIHVFNVSDGEEQNQWGTQTLSQLFNCHSWSEAVENLIAMEYNFWT